MEARSVKLELKTAKQWFRGSDASLKSIALQAFTEEELKDNFPTTWEEFCKNNKTKEDECFINSQSAFRYANGGFDRSIDSDKNILPSKKSAEAHLALMQLEQLRDCYRDGWVPDWNDESIKYVIKNDCDELEKDVYTDVSFFLTFQTEELRDQFFDNFKELIEIAKDLI